MASLSEDLKSYSNEKYRKRDVRQGIKIVMRLVAEFGGIIGIAALTFKLLAIASGILAPLGVALTPALAKIVLHSAFRGYASVSEEERKKIRAFVRWFNGGFSLGSYSAK